MGTANQEFKISKQSISEKWHITAEAKDKILTRIINLIDDPALSINYLLGAINIYMKMEWLNIKRDEMKLKSQPKHIIHHKGMSTEELERTLLEKLKGFEMDTLPPTLMEGFVALQNNLEQNIIKSVKSEEHVI